MSRSISSLDYGLNSINNQETVLIHNLTLRYSGAYHDQFSRPYQSHVDARIINAVNESIHGVNGNYNDSVDGIRLGSLAANILHPQANAGRRLGIVGGWNSVRMMFTMEIEIRTGLGSVHKLIQGYTDHADNSYSGKIDPNTIFYINSVSDIKNTRYHTPNGVVNKRLFGDSALVVCNTDWSVDSWNVAKNPAPVKIRPQDVFQYMTVNSHLSHHPNFDPNEVIDNSTVFNNQSCFSRRQNNLPTEYVGKVLNSYQLACSNPVGNSGDIWAGAIQNSHEKSFARDPFISMIQQWSEGAGTNFFRYGDLLRVDQTIDSRCTVVVPSAGGINDYTMNTENWSGSTREVMAATMLANGVPALMVQYGISIFGFMATNNTIGCQPIINATVAQGLGNDVSQYVPGLLSRIQNELIQFISLDNAIGLYNINFRCELGSETNIDISLDNHFTTPFIFPAFAESILTPVIADENKKLQQITNDLQGILENTISTPQVDLADVSYLNDSFNNHGGKSIY